MTGVSVTKGWRGSKYQVEKKREAWLHKRCETLQVGEGRGGD